MCLTLYGDTRLRKFNCWNENWIIPNTSNCTIYLATYTKLRNVKLTRHCILCVNFHKLSFRFRFCQFKVKEIRNRSTFETCLSFLSYTCTNLCIIMPSYLGHAKRIVPQQLSGKTVTDYQSGKRWDFIDSAEVKLIVLKQCSFTCLSLDRNFFLRIFFFSINLHTF